MYIKYFKYLLNFFKFLIVLIIILKLLDYAKDYTPFVYGLKTQQVQTINYLDNSNPNILPNNTNSVAVFSEHKDISSLEEVFKIAGIPYFICRKLEDTNQSKILFLDLDINKKTILNKREIDYLNRFVSNGGIMIGNEIGGLNQNLLKNIFGYKKIVPSRQHKQFDITSSSYFKYLNLNEEKMYTLSTLSSAPYTNTIIKTTAKPLAKYEDATTAISMNKHGKGKAILLGISLFDLRYRNLLGKDYNANQKYCNDFEPLSDMIILFLKGIYEEEIKKTLTLATAPNGYRSSLVITHDVDFEDSIFNIKKFVNLEKALGVKSTFFIQTKYLTDNKDKAFFNQDTLHFLTNASNNGFEIGTHTVIHTKNFSKLKEGNYSESYPSYRPFSFSDKVDLNKPTVSGELKVAKEILGGLGIKNIVSFRSGELIYNPKLPIAMERLGYRYSSCFSAEDVLSYFPYRYKRNYANLQDQSYIWEMPLSFEDEELPPMYFRQKKALALFEKIHNNGGIFNLLIHPDLTLTRLKNLDIYFEESFIKRLPKDVWISTMGDIGNFWDKRDRIVFRYNSTGNMLALSVYSPVDIEGVGFDIHNIKLNASQNKNVKIINNKIIVNIKKGFNSWSLKTL